MAFTPDEISEFISPKPSIEIGPKIVTTIPPPIKIKIHIPNKKENNFALKLIHPSRKL